MGVVGSSSQRPRFWLRAVLIAATWTGGAALASRVPDATPPRSAAELMAPAPVVVPAQERRHGARPAEAPPLQDPPSPSPA